MNDVYKLQAVCASVQDVPSYLHDYLCAAQLIRLGALTVLLHCLTSQVVKFTSSNQHFSAEIVVAILHAATLKLVNEVQELYLATH